MSQLVAYSGTMDVGAVDGISAATGRWAASILLLLIFPHMQTAERRPAGFQFGLVPNLDIFELG